MMIHDLMNEFDELSRILIYNNDDFFIFFLNVLLKLVLDHLNKYVKNDDIVNIDQVLLIVNSQY
jgi:putative ribosome biogenesis GTPase RsgA